MERHIRRERNTEFIERGLHRSCHRQSIEVRLFVDDEHHAGQAIDRGASDLVGCSDPNLGHMSQWQADSVPKRDGDGRQIVGVLDSRALADRQPLVFRLDKPRSTETGRVSTCGDHLVQRNAILLQSK